MANTWVIADSHWGHTNILAYCNRPHNADELMVAAWKKRVKPADTIWHLGDLMLPKWQVKEWWQHRIAALPGHKHLILGNHDHRLSVSQFTTMGFEVHKKPVWFNWGEQVVVMSHWPYQGLDYFDLNLHGHTHNNAYHSSMASFQREKLRKYRNLCVENTNYAPVSLEDALTGRVGATPFDLGFWSEKNDPEIVQR